MAVHQETAPFLVTWPPARVAMNEIGPPGVNRRGTRLVSVCDAQLLCRLV